MMKVVEAINNYVTIDLLKNEPKEGEIVEYKTSAPSPRWGIVTSVGPGVPDLYGNIVRPPLDVGDLVYTMAHGKESLFRDAAGRAETFIYSELDIMAKMIDKDKLKIQPLGSLVEIEKLATPETTKSGIYITPSQQLPTGIGRVKTLGLGWRTAGGEPIPFNVEEGDLVGYRQFQTLEIDFSPLGIHEKTYLVMHGDICVKILGEE